MEDRDDIDLVAYADVARLAAGNDAATLLEHLRALEADASGADEVLATLRTLRLGDLVLQTLALDAAADPLTDRMRAAMDRIRVRPYVSGREHLRAFEEVSGALATAGIPALLLKGPVLAHTVYGGLDHRPQSDIDVLVHVQHRRRARRVLTEAGYLRSARDSHSVTYRRDVRRVDLHHALRSAPAYRIDEAAAWGAAREVTIEGLAVRTLSDEDTLSLLATSLIEDVGFGMAKLKSTCDIWLVARALDATTDWGAWFERRAAENLEQIAVNACALALTTLDRADDAPRLAEAIAARGADVRVRDRGHALALLTARRGSLDSRRWFASVYPGSPLRYRTQTFIAGLPATLRDVRIARRRTKAF